MNSFNERKHQEKGFFNNLNQNEKMRIFLSVLISSMKLFIHPFEFSKKLTLIIKGLIPNKQLISGKLLYGDDVINELISSNKSLIRWGDGETFVANGQDIYFQQHSISLSEYLHSILDEYSVNSHYLLAVPLTPLLMNPFKLILSGYYFLWYQSRILFRLKSFKSDVVFMDAFLFRPVSSLSSDSIEKLWKDKKVVLVSSSLESIDNFNEKYKTSLLGAVIIPQENAYSQLEEIINSIYQECKNHNKNHIRVLVSAGPTAKVLVYLLSKEGYICYDVGHYLKWKFHNITPKGVL
jgi:hypothetical protein